MNLITIFNYPKSSTNHNLMCNIWLDCAKKNAKDFNVKILTEKGVNPYLEKKINDYGFELITLPTQPLKSSMPCFYHPSFSNNFKYHHNVGFKLYYLCSQIEPFIFIDADAFILKDLSLLKELSQDKPFVAINHENVPGHTSHFPYKFINSGVQVCHDPSFLDYHIITHYPITIPGSDQSLLFSYFQRTNYDYTHKDINYEWNSYARYVTLTRTSKGEWEGISKGLDYTHPVYINHYWYDAKPWQINCPLFKEYNETLYQTSFV